MVTDEPCSNKNALHIVTVSETASSEIAATGAKISVRVTGQSFFTGNQAFEKAAEVATLVAALGEIGVTRSDVSLQSVSIEVESGILAKSSSASYRLLITCPSVDLVGPTLAAISAQKHAAVSSVAWQYSELEAIRRDLSKQAVSAAKATASAVASVLGVTLTGVHRVAFDALGAGGFAATSEITGHALKARRSASAPLESLDLSHSTKVTVTATADFLVSSFV